MHSLTKEKIYTKEREHIIECTYSLIENTVCGESGIGYIVYGIAVLNRMGKITDSISDISCNKVDCEKLIELFNKENLSPVHFHDAVEDWLN